MSTTQCVSGGVSGLYATGKALLDAGVIAGNDVTPEAALTKLSYVISKKAWSMEKKRLMMQASFTFTIDVDKYVTTFAQNGSIIKWLIVSSNRRTSTER